MARTMTVSVCLTSEDRERIKTMRNKFGLCTTLDARCRVLEICNANAGKNLSREEVAELADISVGTVTTTLKKYKTGGVDEVLKLNRSEASDVARLKADGRTRAETIAVACSQPPEGFARWTLNLLASKVQVTYGKDLSKNCIRRILAESELKPHLIDYWCLPTPLNAEFVSRMEDVLDVYERPYNPDIPLVCIDEKSYQLLGEVRKPLPMIPGHAEKRDSEYDRRGTVSMFMISEPYAGIRHVIVSTSRTAVDFAHVLQYVSDVMYPDKKQITLVCDNLNTHDISSLYKTFFPAEANRIKRRFEIHYTPKHGSWLDMAEIELNVLTRQCLDRRIPDIDILVREVAAWEKARNEERCTIHWTFTTEKARVKLRSLYPVITLPDGEYDFLAHHKIVPPGDENPEDSKDAKPVTIVGSSIPTGSNTTEDSSTTGDSSTTPTAS